MTKKAERVTVEVLTPCSGDGWSARQGKYSCPPHRAKMLIARGYAKPVESAD